VTGGHANVSHWNPRHNLWIPLAYEMYISLISHVLQVWLQVRATHQHQLYQRNVN